MLMWYTKSTSTGTYTQRPTPSSYKLDLEDLDNKTYRSIATGNMIDTVVSKNWSKIQFSYNHMSDTEVHTLLEVLKANPIYAKVIDPMYSNGYIEAEFRCSKKSLEMLEDHSYKLSFNLVQKKKVTGQ